MELKHYVSYIKEGQSKNDAKAVEVTSNEIGFVKIPDEVYCIKVFDRATEDVYKYGKKIATKHDLLNQKTYYVGQIVSLDEIKKYFGEQSKIYQEMIRKKQIGGIRTKSGRVHPIYQNQSFNLIAPDQVGIIVTEFENAQ